MAGCHVKPEQAFNLIFGYNGKWDEDLGGLATGATYFKTTSVVPAGEVWVLNAISIQNNTRASTAVYLRVWRASGAVVALNYAAALGVSVPLIAIGAFPLEVGDYARVDMWSTVAGDSIAAGLFGYKMKVTQ